MVRANSRDAISQAMSDINNIPSLDDLNETAVKQGIVLRLLSAAGWNAFDISEIQPEYRTGNTRVDYALMSSSSPRARAASSPRALIQVKSLSDNLESDRYQRQLLAHCAREDVALGVLTNGQTWLLLLSADGGRGERRFCEIDLKENPDAAADDFNRYLTKDRVTNGQAARSAERSLQDRDQDENTKRSIVDAWHQVVRGLDPGLIELIAVAAEQKTGYKPEPRLMRRVLIEQRADLHASGDEDPASPAPKVRGGRMRPASFTFDSETRDVTSWPDLLVGVCALMRERHPDNFERILEIRGRSLSYFSKTEDEVNLPRQIDDTGIYASCQGAGILIAGRARRVVELFNYPADSLVITTR